MMIRLNNEYAVTHRNDYYVIYKLSVIKEGVNAGKETSTLHKTFPRMLCAWQWLQLHGVDSTKSLAAMEKERDDYLEQWNASWLKKYRDSQAKKLEVVQC